MRKQKFCSITRKYLIKVNQDDSTHTHKAHEKHKILKPVNQK